MARINRMAISPLLATRILFFKAGTLLFRLSCAAFPQGQRFDMSDGPFALEIGLTASIAIYHKHN
jgi:hypothetical protein